MAEATLVVARRKPEKIRLANSAKFSGKFLKQPESEFLTTDNDYRSLTYNKTDCTLLYYA